MSPASSGFGRPTVHALARAGHTVVAGTLVLVDEVIEGGWGLGGNVLTAQMLGRS